ncbi:hypothetical protein V6Z11_A07G069800 [Gossypium hirsutum]
MENLADFMMKLRNELYEVNHKFEHLINKMQRDLDAREAKDKQQDAILQTMSNTLNCLDAQIERLACKLDNDDGVEVEQSRARGNNARHAPRANDETLVNNDCRQSSLAKPKFSIPQFRGKNDLKAYCE